MKFPARPDTVKTVIVRDSIIYRDTTVYIKLPGERVADSVPIPCPEVADYIADTAKAETSLARAMAWWQFPRIRLELVQKDTTIERRLDNAIKEAYHWRSEYEKITRIPDPVKYVPKVYTYSLFFSIAVVLAVILYMVMRFRLLRK